MEWPKELLDILNDPLFDGVRLREAPLTADDRRVKKLLEITEWCEKNGGRLPQLDGNTLLEKSYARNLIKLRSDSRGLLAAYDRFNLLNED